MITAEPIRFDPTAHRYHRGTRELIAVTTVLKEAGLIDDRWFTDDAAQRGTYVHLAIELLDRGALPLRAMPAIRPYVEAYRAFCDATRPVWSHVEHRCADDILGYAGTLDRAGTLGSNGTRLILDVKTGAVPAWVGLQLAAYRRCLPDAHTYTRVALQLKADGAFSLHELTDRQDEKTFCAALHLVQWKRGHR